MLSLAPPIVFNETTDLGVRYVDRSNSAANEAIPGHLQGTSRTVAQAAFAKSERAIAKQHKRSLAPLPHVSTLGNPPRGEFPMPGNQLLAVGHLRASRELNDLAVLAMPRDRRASSLSLHLAGKHRAAASNFFHHARSSDGSRAFIGPGGFYTLESFVINHNQIRSMLEVQNYAAASELLNLHFGSWLAYAGAPSGQVGESVDFVGGAIQYLNHYLEMAR